MSENISIRYITQGVHGCASADYVSNWELSNRGSISSYDNLDRFLDAHGDEITDGCPVVDLVPLTDRDDLTRLVWNAPMVDPRKVDDDIARWQGASGDKFDRMLAGTIAGNYFGAVGALAAVTTATDAPGPFDYVSPAMLAAYWQSHGARVGYWSATDQTAVWS